MEAAIAALYRAVTTALTDYDVMWANRVYADLAPSGVIRPYVVFGFNAGGERNFHVVPDAEITLTIKCVALTLADAFSGAGRIADCLNDADVSSSRALDGGPDWIIKTSTALQVVYLLETPDKATRLYHAGNRYRFNMESV